MSLFYNKKQNEQTKTTKSILDSTKKENLTDYNQSLYQDYNKIRNVKFYFLGYIH